MKREPAAVETRDEDFAPGHKPICFLCPPEEDEEEEEEVVTEKRAAAADDAIEEREEVVVEKEEDIMERDNLGCPICCCSDCYDGCFTA